MAKQPQFRPVIDPAGQGPLLVVPTDPGAAGRARAGAGSALAGLGDTAFRTGVFLTAEAQEAERRTKELQRRTAVADFTLDRTQKFLAVRQEIQRTADPDAAAARWSEARGELAPGPMAAGGGDDEEMGQLRQQAYDDRMVLWEGVIAADLQGLRVRQASASLESARKASIEMRDTSLFLERLQAAAPLVGWSEQEVQDEFSAVDRAVSAELTKDRIAAKVTSMPYDRAVAWLNSDGPFYGTGLNPQEKQKFLDEQMGRLTRQQAAAAQEANLAAAVRQRNAAQLLGQAGRGQPVDLDAMWGMVEVGSLDPAHARTVQDMLAKGPVTSDDPAVLQELLAIQDQVARGTAPAQKLVNFALAQAGTKLKDATWTSALEFAQKSFTPQMQAVNDEVQQATRELVTVTQESLDDLIALIGKGPTVAAAENERANQYRQVDYIRRSLMDYVRDHPQATGDDIYRTRLSLLRSLQRQNADQVKSLLEAYEAGKLNPPPQPAAPPMSPPTGPQVQGLEQAGSRLAEQLAARPALPAAIPTGFESLWDTLSAEERTTVLTLLGRGWTPAQILQGAQP
jgi:hypothetical protein